MLRPIASGLLTPFQGLCFLGSHLNCFWVLEFSFNRMITARFWEHHHCYWFSRMKRFTFWVVLGLGPVLLQDP
ncbi:unnamed protein product [Linum tenue]|uniref:Secreted protein n=1 Tax=Linum tenue TaxID=586396 RepID=A0AAV0GYH1_9ROSI|nr:unnamed protein product [Linum tenue]